MASDTTPSGQFVLRIEPGLHAALRQAAAAAGLSLNEYCGRKLASPGTVAGPAARSVARAAEVAGDSLVGIVAFGSWARGTAGIESDVDLLIVLDRQLQITRQLYSAWDEEPLVWDGHPVEPHFVQMGDIDTRASGLWAEVAIDGVVLFERNLEISRRLVEVRRQIAAGRLVRHTVGGQGYWIEAA
jgi:predicted nucleotidyltransferase